MKLCMVGTGYVGLVSGACFAETGADVTCVDIDGVKIERLSRGEIPIHEPGLEEMVARNVQAKRLAFSNEVAQVIARSEVVFVAVGTPRRSDGAADLSAVDRVAEAVAEHASHEVVLVLKSTVPVGTNARVRRIVAGAPHRIHVVSNPEFLKEGDAIRDFMRPDRIVIGADDDDELARDMMSRLYHPVSLSQERIIWMDPESAELTKYVANTMLAMRISFMNEVAALCEKVGADVHLIRQGVGSDERIGSKFLFAGPGYGGSCLDGRETVLVRDASGTRLTRLDRLFAEHLGDDEGAAQSVAALVDGLEVLAWDADAGVPRFLPCAALTRRPYEGEMLEVHTKMGRRIRSTADHPFLTLGPDGAPRGVKLASELEPSDWLPLALARDADGVSLEAIDILDSLPKMGIAPHEVIVRLGADERSRIETMPIGELAATLGHARGRERVHDIRRSGALRLDEAMALGLPLEGAMLGTARNGTYVPRRLALDESFWRVIGLYLAEGCCTRDGRRARLIWSLHPTAEEDLVAELSAFFERHGIKHDVRRATTAMRVSVASRIFAELFLRVLELGADCYSHRIPSLAWEASPTQRMALLSGLWNGDGSWSRLNGGPSVVLEYGTVSRPLADGMMRLLGEAGIVARCKTARMKKSTRDTWFLVVSGADQIERAALLAKAETRAAMLASVKGQTKRIAPTGFRRLSEGGAAVRVVSVDRSFYQGWVYSLEVPEAHTVVASGGLVVHNCFPKDVTALVHVGREHGVELELAAATDRVNHRQKGVLARKLKQVHFGGDLRGKRICIWGIAFKPLTDDIREAPALQLIDTLLSEGAEVRAHDPEALANARAHFGDRLQLFEDAYEAADGADALVLVTEWRQYQNPDFARLGRIMRHPLLLDGRNIWSGYGLRAQGFVYDGIGVRGS